VTVNTTHITSGPYAGNDIADEFSYTFRVSDKTQLSVYETDDVGIQTLLVVDSDYTVAGVGDDAGGIITRVAGALPTNYSWYIRSNYIEDQQTDFNSQGGFLPDVHEAQFDHVTFLIQQLRDSIDRTFKLTDSIELDGVFELFQDATDRANLFLTFNSSGDLIVSTGTGADAGLRGDLASLLISLGASLVGVRDNDGHYTQADVEAVLTEIAERFVLNETLLKDNTINFTSDVDYTLSSAENEFGRLIMTDTSVLLTAARNVIVSTYERFIAFTNETARTLIVKTSAGTGVTVFSGTTHLLHSDGTNVVNILDDTVVSEIIGEEKFWPTDTPPVNFLEEDGSALTMVTYEELYDVIGNTSGLGAGNTVTADGSTDLFTDATHGLVDDDVIELTNSGGALPTGLSADTKYFIVTALTNTFQVSLTRGGTPVDFTGTGTGTHSWHNEFLLPDAQGEHIRIWDNGAGVDPDAGSRTDRGDGTTGDNNLTKQGHAFDDHTHAYVSADSVSGGATFDRSWCGSVGNLGGNSGIIGSTGGNETRGINSYRMLIMRFAG
jgi:hypothetical protein